MSDGKESGFEKDWKGSRLGGESITAMLGYSEKKLRSLGGFVRGER